MIKSLKKNQGGFTLIELMVVIVIIGILVAIALPNFIGAQDRAKLSSVKANMHTFQTVAETYAVDWGGVYPETADMARTEAETKSSNKYWKDFNNPFTSKTGAAGSYTDLATTTTAVANKGLVIYDTTMDHTATYAIYGGDKLGAVLSDKGQAFVLSNS